MTATKAAYNTLDSAAATNGYPMQAHLFRRLGRNANKLLADLMPPCVSHAYDMRQDDAGFDAKGATRGDRHTLRVNAPEGAWTCIVQPQWVAVPPGVTTLTIVARLKIDNGHTAYLYPVTSENPFRVDPDLTGSAVIACVGTGAEVRYTGTVRVKSDPSGFVPFAMYVQTTGYEIEHGGLAAPTSSVGELHDADITTTYSGITQQYLQRDDWWATLYHGRPFTDVWIDDGNPTYTDDTVDAGDDGANDVTPYPTPALNHAIYLGSYEPFEGAAVQVTTQGNTVMTVTPEYWNGAWTALTITTGSEWTDFDHAAGYYVSTWTRPTDWAAYAPQSYMATRFYVRLRISAFTSSTTPAQLGQLWALARPVFRNERIVGIGNETNDTMLFLAREVSRREHGFNHFYTLGRGAKCWVYAVHVRPTALPGIV